MCVADVVCVLKTDSNWRWCTNTLDVSFLYSGEDPYLVNWTRPAGDPVSFDGVRYLVFTPQTWHDDYCKRNQYLKSPLFKRSNSSKASFNVCNEC